jgi:phage-related protein
MKTARFLGDSRARIKMFPEKARKDAGYQLERVQCGLEPDDSKTLVNVGPGIQELRIWDASGTYRVVYIARYSEAVYVLHAFQKKTEVTPKRELELVRQRMEVLRRIRERF